MCGRENASIVVSRLNEVQGIDAEASEGSERSEGEAGRRKQRSLLNPLVLRTRRVVKLEVKNRQELPMGARLVQSRCTHASIFSFKHNCCLNHLLHPRHPQLCDGNRKLPRTIFLPPAQPGTTHQLLLYRASRGDPPPLHDISHEYFCSCNRPLEAASCSMALGKLPNSAIGVVCRKQKPQFGSWLPCKLVVLAATCGLVPSWSMVRHALRRCVQSRLRPTSSSGENCLERQQSTSVR
jgi:hypothetical protein